MDRRSFNKLLAGAVGTVGVPTAIAADRSSIPYHSNSVEDSVTLETSPAGGGTDWELVILDAVPPHLTEVGGMAVGDVDGDGRTEVIVAGNGALLWYRPSTSEKGVIALGKYAVGVAIEDIDGDGRKEIVAGKIVPGSAPTPEKWLLSWYKSGETLQAPWREYVLDEDPAGHPHDLLFANLDGDGRRALVANAMYCEQPGLFAYKVPDDPRGAWKKQKVQSGISAEGTAVGDLNGDGRDEIVSGPYWYSAPHEGAFSGRPWRMHALAPGFRELCRAVVIDVNGDGHLDVILVEDEYPDGRLAWFENRLHAGSEAQWIEHPIDAPFNFAHSLRAWREEKTKVVHIFAGEMNEGGWAAPYNWNARLLEYTTADRGKSWRQKILYEGEGTHEAVRAELDRSGKYVIFGHAAQILAKTGYTGWIQMFRPREKPSALAQYKHQFIDRQKPYTGIDIHAVDVDGDGVMDIVCGAWWYKNPDWERHTIPGVAQIINAYDIDRDGKVELIGIKPKTTGKDFYGALCSELVWLKPIDPEKYLWEEHSIGAGDGDWPHGNVIGPFLPGGGIGLVCGYHEHLHNPPQIFEVPSDPREHPWPKRVIADIPYGEEMKACDLDGDGKLDIVAGPYWLRNKGDGHFEAHLLIDPEYLKSMNIEMICRMTIADVNGDGRPDILFTVEDVDWRVHKAFFAPVGWLENTGDPLNRKFEVHIIDRVRSPHSLSAADLDGDGELEIIVGEHDPFKPYRSQSRLYAYKKADPHGIAWSRIPIDNRFEHHDGAKVVELAQGRPVILSHGWMEPGYVHLWQKGG